MTEQELNTLYIACRDAFEEYYYDLRNTQDNKQFLVNALRCEIYANAVSLCLQLYYELTDSPAVETSCRSILEARALLKMVFDEKLDEEQIANFKHQSALLFYGNIFETAADEKDSVLTNEQSEMMRKQIHWIVEDYERAMDAYRAKYGIEMDERNSRAAIRESLFFTAASAKKKKRKSFTDLFGEYMKDFDQSGTMYQRVSTFAHPWYLYDLNDIAFIREERLKDVNRCLELVQEILDERMLQASLRKGGIDQDAESVGEYLQRSQTIENVCRTLFEQSLGEGNHVSYKALCFAFLRDMLTEMNLLIGLGYPEIALSKFQAVCEFWAMNAPIDKTETPEMESGLQEAFDYSTRVQFRKLGSALETREGSVLKQAFSAAFPNTRTTFEEYKNAVEGAVSGEKASLSFLGDFWGERSKSFLGLVQATVDDLFPSQHPVQKKDFILGYLFSIDVHHATGFCYTENRDCWNLLTHRALACVYELLFISCGLTAVTSDEAAAELAPTCEDIVALLNAERKEIAELSLKYPD